MTRPSLKNAFACAMVWTALLAMPMYGQRTTVATDPANASDRQSDASGRAPTGAPGVYIQDASGKEASSPQDTTWRLLTPNMAYKAWVPDSFGTTPHSGALGELQAVAYPGMHAAVQIHAKRPLVCLYRLSSADAPMLVRLNEDKKKKLRVMGGGGLHVLTIHKATHLATANADEVVSTATLPSTDCLVLLQPQAALLPGEYAVMLGLQNLAIMDFGVQEQ